MSGTAGDTPRSSPPFHWQKLHVYLVVSLLVVTLFAAIVIVADRYAVARYERLFDEQQSLPTSLAKRAVENHLPLVTIAHGPFVPPLYVTADYQMMLNFVLAGVALGLALLVMSVLFFRARQRMLEENARELQRRVAERTAELATSEQLFRLTFELAPVGLSMTDMDGRYLQVNQAFCDTLGYTAEQLAGHHSAEITHPADLDADRALRESLLQGETPACQREKRYIARDGTIVHCLLRVTLMRDANGRPTGFINQIVDITERKRAEEQLRQRTAQLETLRQMALAVTTQLDVNVLLKSIVSRAIDLLHGVRGGFYVYDAERDVLEWAVYDSPVLMAPLGSILHRGEGLSGKVWETGKPVLVDDYEHWEGRARIYEGYPWKAVVAVPVCYGDKFLGVLNLMADPPRTFSQADADLLSLFAAHAAIALHNARLLEREQAQRELAEALAGAAAVVSGTLELDQVLDRILEQAVRAVGGDACNVMLIEDGVARPVRWRGYEPFGADEALSRLAFRVAEVRNLRHITETGQPYIVADTASYPGWVPVAGQEWLRACIGAPIRIGGTTVGFLNVDGATPGQFADEDARWLKAFADHAATAIQNAQLYQQARRDAETKAVLLNEVNHRVKNNLSAIIGLLYIELHYARWQTDLDCASLITEMVSRIQGLAMVHSALSEAEWAPLPLSDLTEQVIHMSLQASAPRRHVSLEVAPSPVRVTPDQAHNLALVINELAFNAVKHAWKDRSDGCLSVRITSEGDMIVFEMRDDGVGYPAEVLSAGGGMGLYLVGSLVEQGLHGSVSVRNERGAVTTVRFHQEV